MARTTYGQCPMEEVSLSAIHSLGLDEGLSNPCSRCRYSDFVHAKTGPCLFSECRARASFLWSYKLRKASRPMSRLGAAVLVGMLRESGLSLTGRLGGPQSAQHGEPTV